MHDPATGPSVPSPAVDLYLIVGWLCVVVIPGPGFFVSWYCFHVAYARSGTTLARVSLFVGRLLSILVLLAFVLGLFLGLLLPILARSGTS